jgi:hypothetical protein
MSLSKDGSTVRRGTFDHSVLASTPYRQHAVGAVATALILTLYMCGSPAAVCTTGTGLSKKAAH